MTTPTKACSSNRDSFTVSPTKGPIPWIVAQMATQEVTAAAAAASRGPNRKAAHTSHGMGTKISGEEAAWPGSHPADPMRHAARSDTNKSPISTDRRSPHWASGSLLHVRSNGATRRIPVESPSHHVSHTVPYTGRGAIPARETLVGPTLAATADATSATAVNVNTSRARSNGLRAPTSRRSRSAPTRASAVLPIQIADETTTIVTALAAWFARKVTTFARNAPSMIPGHTPYPKRTTAARAIPEGGQTGEAFVFSRASRRLRPAAP